MFTKIASFFKKKPKTPPIHTGVKPLSAYHYKKQREYNSPVPSPAPGPSDSSDVLLTALILDEIISSNRISDTDESKPANFSTGNGGDFGGAGATGSWDTDSPAPAPSYESYSSSSSDSGSSWSSSSDSSSSYDSGSSYSDSSSSSSFD